MSATTATATTRIESRPDYSPAMFPGPHLDERPALEVQATYQGVLIGTRYLADELPARRGKLRQGLDPRTHYVIGQSPHADAPAPCDLLGTTDLPLVSKWGQGFLVNTTPSMTGDVAVGGKVYRLADYLAGRGTNFTLPPGARARIDCGAMSFRLDHTTCAEPLPRRWFVWRWAEQKFTVGSILALGLFLLMVFVVPPDGMSVSGDLVGMSRIMVPTTVMAPEPAKVPEVLTQKPDKDQGDSGKAHAGESGVLGDQTSKRTHGVYAIKGDSQERRLGKGDAKAAAKTAAMQAGILGILNSTQGSQFTSIFGSGIAVGDATENVLSNLVGSEIANAYAPGGLGVTGSGPGGGGTGLKTLGLGNQYETVGRNYGHGPGIGGLGTRSPIKVRAMTLGIATVRGSLDKDIIRRVVHLHMNEVKYCYDKELVHKTGLEGRISIQFVISPQGLVLSSVLQSSTMGNVSVEKCVVDAAKRWEFPKPTGGGIAIVAYPFNFVAGGER